MTEQEWVVSTNPAAMLEVLKGKASDRQLRLFAVACCRRIWHLLDDWRSRIAIEVSEKYADQDATHEELSATFSNAIEAAETHPPPPDAAEHAVLRHSWRSLGFIS